jgi:hypothetical protein
MTYGMILTSVYSCCSNQRDESNVPLCACVCTATYANGNTFAIDHNLLVECSCNARNRWEQAQRLLDDAIQVGQFAQILEHNMVAFPKYSIDLLNDLGLDIGIGGNAIQGPGKTR